MLKRLAEQKIFRIEIEVQALPGDSRCPGDVIHGRLLEAVPQEDRCRGHEDGFPLWRAWRSSVGHVHRSAPLWRNRMPRQALSIAVGRVVHCGSSSQELRVARFGISENVPWIIPVRA